MCPLYAVACEATGQMKYTTVMAHKNVCLEVAATAKAKGRLWHVCVLYDEVVRKDWANRSLKQSGVNLDKEAVELNETALRRAEAKYDDFEKAKANNKTAGGYPKGGGPKGQGKGQGKHQGWKRPYEWNNKFKDFERDWKKARSQL